MLKVLLDAAGTTILNNDQEALKSFTNLVDQLPSVFGEVFLYPTLVSKVVRMIYIIDQAIKRKVECSFCLVVLSKGWTRGVGIQTITT